MIDSLGSGGAERSLVYILKHLDRGEILPRVCVLQVSEGNQVSREIRNLNIPVDFVPVPFLREPGNLLRLIRYLRKNQPDILLTQLEFANTLGNLTARILNIPSAATLHTVETDSLLSRANWRKKLMWLSLRYCCRKVIAVSEETRRYSIKTGNLNPDQVQVIHNGVEINRFRRLEPEEIFRLKTELNIPHNSRVLMTLAVLRQLKGIHYMLPAFLDILKTFPESHYLIVGDGPYAGNLKALARELGVSNHVTFSGMRNDVPRVLAVGDLFILPTLEDAFPTVLLEAMASSIPLVASNVGGVPEIVIDGETGLLVPPANSGELAKACKYLLSTPAIMARMADAGRNRVKECFDVTLQVNKLSDLFRQLLTGHF